MNKIILSILTWMTIASLYSQQIGEWNTHFSYEANISAIAQADTKIFAVSDGKLFSYDSEDESVEVYSKINANDITNIAYSKKQNCLIIIRNNGDIDLLYPNGTYSNIPDLKNITENIDKKVNDIYIHENFAYLSANFGLIVINLERVEIKESLIARYPFYTSCIYNGLLYSTTSNGSKTIDPSDNIQDISRWTSISFNDKFTGGTFSDADIRSLIEFDGFLTLLIPNRGLFKYKDNVVTTVPSVGSILDMTKNGIKLVCRGANAFMEITDLQSTSNNKTMTLATSYLIQDNSKSGVYWAGINNNNMGALKVDANSNNFEILKERIRPSGPLSNYPYYLAYENNKLLYTGGRASTTNHQFPGRWGEYDGREWINCNLTEINSATSKSIQDVVSFKYSPYDASQAFVCSWNEGLLELKDKKLTKLYNETNSPLYRQWINLRISGGVFDKSGNFWFLNTGAAEPVKVIKKDTHSVISLSYDTLNYSSQRTNMKNITIDRYNNKWITSYGGSANKYLAVFNENGTIENIKDDKLKHINKFYSQDGDLLDISELQNLVEDKTGNLWLGTDIGIFVIYNSSNIFNKNYEIILNKIKIPRNDGTNTADILLEGVPITSIVVDGANRKWVGTLSGVYLLSSNGYETIEHFTTQNSLLPSNSIISMTMDHETGTIYFGTEKGIVSYKSEATEGAESYSNVYAYPNPIKPDYEGPITITGLKANSTVKVTDIKGNLINEGKSTGGQYVWDGRNIKRDRVDTGVYLVFGSSEDGQDGVVTKIMVVTD